MVLKMKTNCLSTNREMIIKVLEFETGEAARGCCYPEYSCRVGDYTLCRDGTIERTVGARGEIANDHVFEVLASLGLCDFTEDYQNDHQDDYHGDYPDESFDDKMRYKINYNSCNYPESQMQCNGSEQMDGGKIAYTMKGHSGISLLNLMCIISARGKLMSRALGARSRTLGARSQSLDERPDGMTRSSGSARPAFSVEERLMKNLVAHPPETPAEFLQRLYRRDDEYRGIRFSLEQICFTGFECCPEDERDIHRQLADRIMEAALSRQWMKPFSANVRNQKYAFRTWMNSIGMTGPEYERARELMLGRLPGRSDQRPIPRRKKVVQNADRTTGLKGGKNCMNWSADEGSTENRIKDVTDSRKG